MNERIFLYKICISIFLMTSVLSLHSQIEITGKITDRDDNALVGVTIREKETDNGTLSDFEGNFRLIVADTNSIIEFLFVGYKVKEIPIGDKRNLTVKLKEDCCIDFFDGRDLLFGLSSDPINKQFGIYSQMSSYTKIGTLLGKLDYLSNFSDNYQLDATLGLLHFLVDCDYYTSAFFNYRNLKIIDKLQLSNYNIEGKLTFSRPKIFPNYTNLFVGFGLSEMNKTNLTPTTQAGYMLGLGTAFRLGKTHSEINFKSTYWTRFWEWKVEFSSQIKRFIVSADLDIIDSDIITRLRIGYNFGY